MSDEILATTHHNRRSRSAMMLARGLFDSDSLPPGADRLFGALKISACYSLFRPIPIRIERDQDFNLRVEFLRDPDVDSAEGMIRDLFRAHGLHKFRKMMDLVEFSHRVRDRATNEIATTIQNPEYKAGVIQYLAWHNALLNRGRDVEQKPSVSGVSLSASMTIPILLTSIRALNDNEPRLLWPLAFRKCLGLPEPENKCRDQVKRIKARFSTSMGRAE